MRRDGADGEHELRYGILGSLEVLGNGRPIAISARKQRIVLAMLLCRANTTVPVGALREALWDDEPPRTAQKNIQVYVSGLRGLLGQRSDGARGDRPLRHNLPGYSIQVEPDQLDTLRQQQLVRAGRQAMRDGAWQRAADTLGQAVRLWRGPILPDLVSVPGVAAEADRLLARHLSVLEDWAEANLALGRHGEIVDELDQPSRQQPFRERLRRAQLLALYRSGRHTEAFAQYESMRQQLSRELGLAPSPVLAGLYESMLRGDPDLTASQPAPVVAAAGPGVPLGRVSMPRDIADFTGRGHETDVLLGVLGAGRDTTAVVSGPAGMGKTALAVHCAHRLADQYPDGRVMVSLRASDGGPRVVPEVLGELLREMGVSRPVPHLPDERAGLFRSVTAGRRVLVILDDAVTESQVRSLLAATGGVAIVVTSRRQLSGVAAAVRIALDPLSESEARDLFGRLVGSDRVAAQPAAARRLLAGCAGLPLALRIVGGKLGGLRHLALDRYADRLADGRALLTELTAGDLDLRARLSDWYHDLRPDDRATLRLLAASAEPNVSVGEVARGLGVELAHAEAAIERLAAEHFVEPQPAEVEAHDGQALPQFVLPPLVRSFVRELSRHGT
ncbi:NB-ARC domain-containing protein [Actinoplanes sp. KI2]|uniref:AfsR/SARP family transcriptional regulator n=1 Tax=Actinoplanes sp. KI2 TaxID=2983315 RepID=UPI0021D607BD|nr:BTAD domain-containing putative transcriptional regulator [Actinoplanes sp. KI2]MCU7730692.1 NB-ARC domain-containing protein [Actinoplanes sp. KI2]